MSEALTENQVEQQQVVTQQSNPFDDKTWVAPENLPQVTPTISQENLATNAEPTIETSNEPNYNDWVKKEFGYDSVEVAKQEFENLKKFKEQPTKEEIKFANEQSEKIFKTLQEGKIDDVYEFLKVQKKVDKILNEEINESNAEEIIKLNMQSKYKDLSADEINYQFNREFKLPKKPSQSLDQTDDEYEETLNDWTNECNEVKKGMIIQAKLAKPDIAKLKSELVLPTLESKSTNQPTQEELQQIEKWQKDYESSVEAEYKVFDGLKITAKCGDAELPISYQPTETDKTALKDRLLDFDAVKYLEQRWVEPTNQTVDVKKAIGDLYFLENKDAILQKVANDAAAQMFEHIKKQASNIQLNTNTQTSFQPNAKSKIETFAEGIWNDK
jgi:hypothetical protein